MQNTKNIIVAVSTLGMVMVSTLAMSECRPEMGAEMLAECITIEGSGANYQDWRAQYEQAMRKSEEAPAQQLRNVQTGEVMISQNPLE